MPRCGLCNVVILPLQSVRLLLSTSTDWGVKGNWSPMVRLASLPLAPHRASPINRGTIVASPPFASRLVVMVKEPVAGRVKTRLAREVGAVRATSFYRTTSSALLARVYRPSRWHTQLAVAPDAAVTSRAWRNYTRRRQGNGDLGKRMQRILDTEPPGPVVVIGTDVPTVTAAHIAAALKSLGSHDAVFGPSPDGGYWLVGFKRRPRIPRAFASVKWSSRDTLAHTLANLSGLSVARIDILADVDEAGDLAKVGSALGRTILPVTHQKYD
jgi:rSAM/selenodomain-associated transferase 1